MRFAFLLAVFTVLNSVALAQRPTPNNPELERFSQQLYLEAMRTEPHQAELEKQREAKCREAAFVHQANRFVELWTKFTREFNERGTMNIKSARQMVKAFHQLEKSDAWVGSR